MLLIKVGKIVSTHGIKGEIKILSSFPYKNQVFVVDKTLYIDNKAYIIKSYRHHKQFEMVTLNDYKDINEVLFLMKKDVFFAKDDLQLSAQEVLDEDLITFKVLTNQGKKGIIKEIFLASPTNKILRVLFDKEVLIPFNSPMIKKIDKTKKEILVELFEGLGDQDED